MVSVYIENRPQDVTMEELAGMLYLLPEWRRKQVLRYKYLIDRVLCARAYLLLCRALRERYGITASPTFGYTAYGKPLLMEYGEIHFNISHSHNGVMCVVGDEPVGCDIEDIPSKVDMDLCRYCFSEEEISSIRSDARPGVAFARLWTRKEALLKYTGVGLNDNLRMLLSSESALNVSLSTVDNLSQGYVYTVCRGAMV